MTYDEHPVTIMLDPGGTGESGTLYALIAEHGENDEGLLGIPNPLGQGVVPAVVLSRATADKVLTVYGQQVANGTGKTVKMVRFTVDEVITVYTPASTDG